SAGGVPARHDTEAQVSLPQDVAERSDDVPRLEGAGRRLGKERRVEQEVDVVDERDARALRRHHALERARGVEAAEATTRYDDVPRHLSSRCARPAALPRRRMVTPCNKLLQGPAEAQS